MSRRAIALISVFFAGLVVANIVILAIWLPNRKNNSSQTAPAKPTTAGAQSNPSTSPASAPQPNNAGGFAVERQVPSTTGNLNIKYLRDRNTKMHRIAVEDSHQPDGGTILAESKKSIWALVSPDDQWIVIQERGASGDGSVRLFHRANNSTAQFTPASGNGPAGLEDTIWKAYLNSTRSNPNTPRRAATINATGWEDDSKKLDLSVVYLAGPKKQDVPAPWSCTYDVTSSQVEAAGPPPPNQGGEEPAPAEQPETGQQVASNNPFADNAGSPQTDDAADDSELPGERFPATRLDELMVADVNESSLSDVNYAINEMYARHGVDFKDRKVTQQFSEFSWYKPRPGLGFADAEAEFTDLEKQNLKVLRQCREAKTAAAHRKPSTSHAQKSQDESTAEKVMRGIRMWQDSGAPVPHP